MIVRCEKCNQSYRIDENKLPSQGGKIKCSQCAHVFFVKSHQDMVQVESKPESGVEEGWRLLFGGLSYNFQNIESMRNWMLGRKSLESVRIAKGNDDWKEIGDYEGVLSTELIEKFFPLGSIPTSQQVGHQVEGKEPSLLKMVASAENRDQGVYSRGSSSKSNVIKGTGGSILRPVSSSKEEDSFFKISSVRHRAVQRSASQRPGQQEGGKGKGIVTLIVLLVIFVVILQYFGFVDFLKFFRSKDVVDSGVQDEASVVESVDVRKKGQPNRDNSERIQVGSVGSQVEFGDESAQEATEKENEERQIREKALEEKLMLVEDLIKKRQLAEARAVLMGLKEEYPESEKIDMLLQRVHSGLGLGRANRR